MVNQQPLVGWFGTFSIFPNLTFIFFRGVAQPPTRPNWVIHTAAISEDWHSGFRIFDDVATSAASHLQRDPENARWFVTPIARLHGG